MLRNSMKKDHMILQHNIYAPHVNVCTDNQATSVDGRKWEKSLKSFWNTLF